MIYIKSIFKKKLYPLSKPLLSFEKFWWFGGDLDKRFYGNYNALNIKNLANPNWVGKEGKQKKIR